jgi:hypothetical protein
MKTTILKSATAAAIFALDTMITMPAQAADCPAHAAAPAAKTAKADVRSTAHEEQRLWYRMYGGGN